MMRVLLCNCSASLPLPTVTPSKPQTLFTTTTTTTTSTTLNWPQKTLISALTGALSLGLAVSPLSSLALPSPLNQPQNHSTEYCRQEEREDSFDAAPESITDEGIVEEAWEIVNDSFLDTGRHRWSPDTWLRKKEDILATSIQTRSKAHDMIRRMLASLGDPYTRFLSPAEFSKMGRYDMTGIGINLREVPDENGAVKLKVLGLILDGPAHTAGVRQGDEVLAVNGVDVKGKSAFEVSSLLQGPNETFVTVQVKHGNCGPVQSIEVQRQLVARTPVLYRLEQIENGATFVGYVRLKEFNALARKDLFTAMKRLQDLGASSFILDLRDNRGGLVQVLVNKNTASASEIVASALHDNCRAVLVGERTFGKGLIQSVFELHDGSGVIVTIGKYVTPNHMDINGNGIEPDFQKFPAWIEVTKHLSKCHRLQEG
ncbi:carboxyl-terminal-processing peptidase 1, chloroplastic isoform X4 [Rhododendron vialii]|uniref:carboxyl-terminal-processing peptidase 1, chloroplastic isoform X4 n=1 Tax=Rhododendron vialii TaxID=182163 RepID=UPI00265E40C1|nr:carboxyl-terminal-processing peptidase 1, chloroplastic isoform X4 [Rhododendron vialii]